MNSSDVELHVHSRPVQEGAWAVSFKGTIDFSTAEDFTDKLNGIFDRKDLRAILFDLGELSYISSIGLSAVVGAFKRAREADVALHLYDPTVSVRRVLEISKLSFLVLDPAKTAETAPLFAGYVAEREPERQKRRDKETNRRLPPRLVS